MSYRSLLIRCGRNLILIGIVAGACFVLGLLGQLFRYYSDPITLLMPTTGLALAATLLLGNSMLLGVLIGGFCVNAWAYDFNPEFITFYALSALGYALSALIGTELIRKKIGFPNPLLDSRSIILFMFLGGPLSAVISSGIGILAMIASGILSPDKSLLVWLNWWLGDTLGVLIFTPIILSFFAEPQPTWHLRRSMVTVPILVLFSLITALFFYLKYVDHQQYTQQLKEKTNTFSQALKNRLVLDMRSLQGLKSFLLSTKTIEPQEILLLTNQILSSFKEIKIISWINDVDSINKKQILLTYKEHGLIVPKTFQLLAPELRKKIVAEASFSGSEILVQEKNGFKLIIPVAKKQENKETTLGVLIASVSMETLILEIQSCQQCSMTITTVQSSFLGATHAITGLIYSNIDDSEHEIYQSIAFPLADQTWKLDFYNDWIKDRPISEWSVGWLVFFGLWFIGALSIVLLNLTGKYLRKEGLIEERTKMLTETKAAAESANNAKNQFLAKISHELRTPLNGISGFAQLLEKKQNLNVEDRKHIAIIKQCSDNLLKLINDILDISAIESRQIRTEISGFNFSSLLNDCVRICKFRADEKGLELIVDNNCVVHDFLGDEKRIRQILVNLIDNAIKYTDQGSVKICSLYEEGVLKISVADTGCGIAQHNVEQIFSPFVQLDNNNFSQEGIGLGLSITKELVNFMKGSLTVTSQLGIGSVFSVLLPLPISPRSQVRLGSEQQEADKFYGKQVLIVDDNEINLLFLGSLLEHLGSKVDVANDGRQALAMIGQGHYDFVFVDINMPIMNGFEMVKRMPRQQYKQKIIAVSAYTDKDKIKEALSCGFDAYLTKPIEEHQLVELIEGKTGGF